MKKTYTLLAVLLMLLLSACAGGSGDKSAETAAAEMAKAASAPVELNIFINSGGYSLDKFMEYYGNAVQKKYPNFSFKMNTPSKGVTLQDLISQGVPIDLIQTHRGNIYEMLIDLNLQNDISDLIKKYNYDLSQIQPSVLEEMKQLGNGKILGLPYESRANSLFYNKDIFDKFGVAYPKAGITWDQTYELAQKLSREDGGIQYPGFVGIGRHINLMNQMSQGYVDIKTDKASLQSDGWKKQFDTLTRFFKIPNNDYVVIGKAYDTFWKEGRAGMLVCMFVPDADYIKNTQIHWDVVGMPTMKEKPGVGSGLLNYYFDIASSSKHRDQAFLTAAFLGSEEYQLPQARKGYSPSLKGTSIRASIGKDVPYYAD
ncbi:MAG: extracellular solute-binding protein family 1, partial [Paenibacillaceae bacterium]|nr:extracellular solute-binding protein family 1 [Paenibacillaceae bacterium]